MTSYISDGIILIGVVIAAATLSQVFISSMAGIQESSAAISRELSGKIKTSIEIITAVNSSDTTAEVWVKNIGTSIMPPALVMESTILFGEYGNFEYVAYSESGVGWSYALLNGDDNNWHRSETIQITITSASAFQKGDYYFAIATHNGVMEELIFTIGS